LSQVLSNLIANAIKFTAEGQVELQVTCNQSNTDKALIRFEIIDTGIGIPEDKHDLIFERFTQAESDTTKKYGGTGLGLAICKKLLTLQGSNIYIESVVGEGTKFWFDLEFQIAENRANNPESSLIAKPKDLEAMNILLVDDNPMNRMVASQFLDKWNARYEEAENGQIAVEKCKVTSFDAILMDLQMPIKDGYQAANEIRSSSDLNAQTPIIALSASVSNEVTEKIKKYGMNEYISKPFDPVILFRKLSECMNGQQEIGVPSRVSSSH